MNARATRLFAEYASAHSTAGNRACHLAGIPLIVFSVVLALSPVRVAGRWSAAEAVIVAVSIAALWIDAVSAALFFAFLVAADLVSRAVAARAPGAVLGLAAGVFVAGWIFQLVGHAVFEKNRPAFLRNLSHLLIGPLWIAKELI